MTVYSGKTGKVVFDTGDVTRVSNWSMESSFDTLDITDLGEGARSFASGLKTTTGSMSVFYHDDDNTLKSILSNVITTGTPQEGKLVLRVGGNKGFTFNALINSASITCSVGEVVTAEIGFTATGEFVSIGL